MRSEGEQHDQPEVNIHQDRTQGEHEDDMPPSPPDDRPQASDPPAPVADMTTIATSPAPTSTSPSESEIRLVPAISTRQKIVHHDRPLPNIVKGRHVFYPSPDSEQEASFQVRKTPLRDPNNPTDWDSNSKVNQKPKSTATSFRGLRSSLLKIVPSARRNPSTALNPPIDYSSSTDPSKPPPELPRIHRDIERIGPKRVAPKYQPALQTFVNQLPQKHPTDGSDMKLKPFKPFNKRNPRINTVNRTLHGKETLPQLGHAAIEAFRNAIWSQKYNNKDLFDLYLALPGMRMEYLDRKTMDRAIAAFMSVPLRDETAMLRYMTIIEDMHASNIPLTRPEWNQAMSLVAFAYRHVTHAEVDTVLQMWSNMEENYNIMANIDTFNILLDIASKAKNHDLFHRLLGEIRRRRLEWDRFTHTILITHCGTMGDAAEVSRAYKNMVDAGEIIDVTVLNAVITAMLACNEFLAAERVYEHMRQLTLYDPEPLPSKPLSTLLTWITRKRPAHPYELARDQAQKLKLMARLVEYSNITKASLKPNHITYHIFILYFCKVGDWNGLRHIVTHMNDARIPANAQTYEALFRGFATHGQDGSEVWKMENLKRLLDEVLYNDDGQIQWLGALVRKLIMAVARVSKDRELTHHYWKESLKAWEKQGGKVDHMTMAMYNQIMHDFDTNQQPLLEPEEDYIQEHIIAEDSPSRAKSLGSALKDKERIERERMEAKEKRLREREWKVRMLMEKGKREREERERETREAEAREKRDKEAMERKERAERERRAWLEREKRERERINQETRAREVRRQEQEKLELLEWETRERERLQREQAKNEVMDKQKLEMKEQERAMRAFWEEEAHAREVRKSQQQQRELETKETTLPPKERKQAAALLEMRRQYRQREAEAKRKADEDWKARLAMMSPQEREKAEAEMKAKKAEDDARERKLMRMVFEKQSKQRTLF